MRNQFIEDKDRGFIVRKKINEDFLKLFVYTDSPFLSSNGLTLNYLPKYNNDHALINSVVYDDGSNVGIGTSNPINATGYTSLTINSPTNGGRVDLQKNGTQFGLIYSAGSNLMDIEAIGSNNIRFNTNLTNRMFISSSGNVGIGTSTPNEKLTVVGGISASGNVYANSLRIRDSRHIGDDNFSVTWDSALSGTQVSIGGLSGSYMDFSTPLTNDYNLRIGSYILSGGEWNGIGTGPTEKRNLTFLTCDATRMAITSSGNVGIGTNTPSDKLTVNGNILAANNIKSTVGMFSNGEGDEYILFDPNTDSVSIGANSTVGIFLESTSNVGIGTSTPNEKLTVVGGISATGTLYSGNTYLNRGDTSREGGQINFNRAKDNTTSFAIDVYSDTIGSTDSRFRFIDTVSNTERMTILSGGNVGIGTSAPNQKLTVVGGISATKDITVNGITIGRGGGNIVTNTIVGEEALDSNTTGYENTAVGRRALQYNTVGLTNTAVGVGANKFNLIGNNNTAVGGFALQNNLADNNTAVGRSSLQVNTTGINNTASGVNALFSNTTGNNNTANGVNALLSNTTGFNNTAYGQSSLLYNLSGLYNAAVGMESLRNNTTGSNNTAVGNSALFSNTTGNVNTALGFGALSILTVGSNVTGLGNGAQATAPNQVQLGDSATTTYAYGAVQDRSDIRDKADVRDTTLGLEFVNALRPVDFKWDIREDYRPEAPESVAKPAELKEDATEEEKAKYAQELSAYEAYVVIKDKWLEDVKLANITHDGSKKRSRFHHGLIAQEVKAVLDAKGIDFGGFQDHSVKGGDDVLSIGYEELIAPMLKAIQELSAEVAALKAAK
jgi:hypothetical protein